MLTRTLFDHAGVYQGMAHMVPGVATPLSDRNIASEN